MLNDLISRQAAIDAMQRLYDEDVSDYGVEVPEAFNRESRDRAIYELKCLPSAQPEIIRCKDCWHYPSEYADCPMIGWARNENDFCSKAERKDNG